MTRRKVVKGVNGRRRENAGSGQAFYSQVDSRVKEGRMQTGVSHGVDVNIQEF